MGARNESIDESGVVEFHLLLKRQKFRRFLDVENLFEQFDPKDLAFAFLVAFSLPAGGEFLCGFLLLGCGHCGWVCLVIDFIASSNRSVAFPQS